VHSVLPPFTSEARKRYDVALEVRSCKLIEENSVVYVKKCTLRNVVLWMLWNCSVNFIGFQIVLSSVSLEQMLLFLAMCR